MGNPTDDGRGGGNRPPPADVLDAARGLRKRRRSGSGRTGIPLAVQKLRNTGGGRRSAQLDVDSLRQVWMLDILAWARYGMVAPRVDLRGAHAAMPPVVLPDAPDGELVCLDLASSVDALRSRHRAFSQIAGRYSPLVLAARDVGRRLRIEVWDLEGSIVKAGEFSESETMPEYPIPIAASEPRYQTPLEPAGATLENTLLKVARYIDAEIQVEPLIEVMAALSGIRSRTFPAELLDRNPLAWSLALATGAQRDR